MEQTDWLEYALLNLSVAIAIALDAMVMIIINNKELEERLLLFTALVAFTHIVFPLAGFSGGFVLLTKYRFAASAVYLLGALLLLWLLKGIIAKAQQGSETLTKPKDLWELLAMVYTVSVDALLTGPSKNFLTERYETSLVYASFVIVGVLVGFFVLLAGLAAAYLFSKAWQIENISVAGQITLFTLFVCLCLGDALTNLPGRYRIAVSFETTLLIGLFCGVCLTIIVLGRIARSQRHRQEGG